MKLQSIQLLRGIAALLVVFYHALGLQIAAAGPDMQGASLLQGFYANGYAGVDLFFVISGFIMVWVTRQTAPGLPGVAEFLVARVTRIYPLWWAAALAATLFYLFLSVPDANDPAWRAALREGGAAEFLTKSFLLIPQPDLPVLSPGWSLIHEVYFYSVFALLLLLPRAFLPLAMLVWGGVLIIASLTGVSRPDVVGYLSLAVHPLTMEFIFGAVVGLMLSSGFSARSGLITLGAALWFTAMLCYHGEPTVYTLQWGRVLAFGLPGAALIYGLVTLEQHGRLAWLVPVAAAVITCGAVYQFHGLTGASEESLRRAAVIVAAVSGLAAAGAVMGLGWLCGRYSPGLLHALRGPLESVFNACARTGDWSYSIYLGHIFVIGACIFTIQWLEANTGFGAMLSFGREGFLDDAVYVAAVFSGALLAGWLGYRLVERPAVIFFKWVRRQLFPDSRRARER